MPREGALAPRFRGTLPLPGIPESNICVALVRESGDRKGTRWATLRLPQACMLSLSRAATGAVAERSRHVRIVAPLERRIVYVARREGLSETRARERIQLKDRDRTRYLQSRYHCHPDDPLYYDLMITTGVLDLDSAVELVLLALEHKARTLALPHPGLGPPAGLSPSPPHPPHLPPPGAHVDGPQHSMPTSEQSALRNRPAAPR